jgi:hypothetical protein
MVEGPRSRSEARLGFFHLVRHESIELGRVKMEQTVAQQDLHELQL